MEGNIMKIDRNIIIAKAGGTSGSKTMNYKISIPAAMIKGLEVTPEDKSVTMEWDEEQKTIKIYKKNKRDA